jgi:hypothetical protein
MNTARFCQFHDVWGNKWSFCSEKKEIGTMISSWILYWVLLPYKIDTGTLCLLQILQTRLVHSARWSGMTGTGWTHIYNKKLNIRDEIIVPISFFSLQKLHLFPQTPWNWQKRAVFINYSGSNKKYIANKTCPFSTVVRNDRMNTHIQQKVEKCQVNNISGTPELDINYSMGGWGRATSGNFNFYWR